MQRSRSVLVALPFGAGYLLLAGMPISAIRAYGMMVLFILAILIDRRGLTLHHVALMAILLLLLDPGALNDPAFQMSLLRFLHLSQAGICCRAGASAAAISRPVHH